jgi:hypothetical protein
MNNIDQIVANLDKMSPKELAVLSEQFMVNKPRFIPSPGPQTEAWNSKADILLYGGQAGGGKTALGIGLALCAHKRSLLMRRQGVNNRAMIEELLNFYGSRDGFNGKPPESLRTDDSRFIEFGHALNAGDERAWMGQAHDFLYLDEATHFLESQVRFLMGWVRTTDPNQRCRVVLGTNPPISSDGEWVVSMFAPWLDPLHPNPAKPGELRWFVSDPDGNDYEVPGPEPFIFPGVKKSLKPLSRTFIPARLSDNPFLARTDYEAKLDSLKEPLRSAVRDGNFMIARPDAERQVIPTAWVHAAQDRWEEGGNKEIKMTSIGLDCAGGGADAAVIARRHGGWYSPLVAIRGSATADGTAMAAEVLKVRKDAAPVVVDVGGGYAGAIIERFKDNSIHYNRFNGAEKGSGKAIGTNISFANRRSEAWWRFREALDPDQEGGSIIALPPDTDLRIELCAPTYDARAFEITGKYLIESKDAIRKRLQRSTDRADAVVMALTYGSHENKPKKLGFNRNPQVIMKGPKTGRRR